MAERSEYGDKNQKLHHAPKRVSSTLTPVVLQDAILGYIDTLPFEYGEKTSLTELDNALRFEALSLTGDAIERVLRTYRLASVQDVLKLGLKPSEKRAGRDRKSRTLDK